MPVSQAAALVGCKDPEVVIRTPQLAGCDAEEERTNQSWRKPGNVKIVWWFLTSFKPVLFFIE